MLFAAAAAAVGGGASFATGIVVSVVVWSSSFCSYQALF